MKTLQLKLIHDAGRTDLEVIKDDGTRIDIRGINPTLHITGFQGVKVRLEFDMSTAGRYEVVTALTEAIKQLGEK